jgi:hypothetical protein
MLPNDQTIQRSVRDFAIDHAGYEAKHHAYFRQVFECVWPTLTVDAQLKVGTWLPEIIIALLRPDSDALLQLLQIAPFECSERKRIVDEIVQTEAVRETIRSAARPTLQMLQDNGVFRDCRIVDCFRSNGLAV